MRTLTYWESIKQTLNSLINYVCTPPGKWSNRKLKILPWEYDWHQRWKIAWLPAWYGRSTYTIIPLPLPPFPLLTTNVSAQTEYYEKLAKWTQVNDDDIGLQAVNLQTVQRLLLFFNALLMLISVILVPLREKHVFRVSRIGYFKLWNWFGFILERHLRGWVDYLRKITA